MGDLYREIRQKSRNQAKFRNQSILPNIETI